MHTCSCEPEKLNPIQPIPLQWILLWIILYRCYKLNAGESQVTAKTLMRVTWPLTLTWTCAMSIEILTSVMIGLTIVGLQCCVLSLCSYIGHRTACLRVSRPIYHSSPQPGDRRGQGVNLHRPEGCMKHHQCHQDTWPQHCRTAGGRKIWMAWMGVYVSLYFTFTSVDACVHLSW